MEGRGYTSHTAAYITQQLYSLLHAIVTSQGKINWRFSKVIHRSQKISYLGTLCAGSGEAYAWCLHESHLMERGEMHSRLPSLLDKGCMDMASAALPPSAATIVPFTPLCACAVWPPKDWVQPTAVGRSSQLCSIGRKNQCQQFCSLTTVNVCHIAVVSAVLNTSRVSHVM